MDEAALAQALEAEAACLWHGWAAALVVAAAACVAGEDPRAIRALPDAGDRPNRIVLLRGHVVDIGGGSLPQLLRLGGARAVKVGAVDRCEPAELAATLREEAVAGLYLARPGGCNGGMALAPFVWQCREAGRPALVAILGQRPHAPALDAGADLVIIDGTALGGPPCGIVAGGSALVRACRLQANGIGRALAPRPTDLEQLARALAAGRR